MCCTSFKRNKLTLNYRNFINFIKLTDHTKPDTQTGSNTLDINAITNIDINDSTNTESIESDTTTGTNKEIFKYITDTIRKWFKIIKNIDINNITNKIYLYWHN